MTPQVAFGTPALDRADHVRSDPARLAELIASDTAVLLSLDGLVPELSAHDTLVWNPLSGEEGEEHVFLGFLDGAPAFARVPAKGDELPAYVRRDTWPILSRLSARDLATYGGARSLVDWHARHRFCARCGGSTRIAKGGWQRDCEACEAQHFPRVDPVAIMLVEHDGHLLLGRQSRFPPRSYSALAGFIEPGETIEQAVAREVLEEAGVEVTDVRYIASQPWPFPSQLMVGCHSIARSRDLSIDYTELEDARWFTRDEVAEALAKGQESPRLVPPPPTAIAWTMLEWWLEKQR